MYEKISIILPVYNSEKNIKNAILSVINQTYNNFELIIINDGSTDNTQQLVELYLSDKRIKVINTKNFGVSNARNVGIINSNGKYITFIDSDDEYRLEFLEKMIKAFENKDVQLAVCGYIGINTNIQKEKNIYNYNDEYTENKDIVQWIERTQSNNLFNQVWNKIFLSDIIKDNNLKFNVDMNFGEDYRFVIDYISKIKKVKNINDTLYKYTNSTNGLNSTNYKNRFNNNIDNFKYLEKTIKVNEKKYFDKKFVRTILSGISYSRLEDNENTNNFIEFILNNSYIQKRALKMEYYKIFKYFIINKRKKILKRISILLILYNKMLKKIKFGY